MITDLDIQLPKPATPDEDDLRPTVAPLAAPLPAGLVMTERVAGAVRRYLIDNELSHYRIFSSDDLDLEDVERHLEALGETAQWRAIAAASEEGAPLNILTQGAWGAKIWAAGILHLRVHEIVLARWYWLDEIGQLRTLWICGAPSAAQYVRLRDDLRARRRLRGGSVWQIVRNPWQPPERIKRDAAENLDLILSPGLRNRVDSDIVRFFSPAVAALYSALKVPYRRGVLLYGPPGNGKTSIVRLIGASLPEVPMFVLRPCARFNTDSFQTVIERWTSQAPAGLIIEDLDWLLKQLDVSAFLNALDGIDASGKSRNAGMLVIATTNNPQQLDPAINNRPGRFDLVLEIQPPDRQLRREFLGSKLPSMDAETIDQAADQTDGLSFAHLQEILRASGLSSIHAGRAQRTAADLLDAIEVARAAHDQASRGFPAKLEVPFGLVRRKNG